MRCIFVTDLHGQLSRYEKLFSLLRESPPNALFLGGDLLPFPVRREIKGRQIDNFVLDYLLPQFANLQTELIERYPRVLLIPGNDDPRSSEPDLRMGEERQLWLNVHNRSFQLGEYVVYGYACVPPTPFLLKDWERYDVSRFVDVGCISPEEGFRTVPVDLQKIRFATIQKDLELLVEGQDLSKAVFLFHTPPYQTALDQVDQAGKLVDGVPLDTHVGSIAVRRLIEVQQPLLTMHGHIHESAQLSGCWQEHLGRTLMISAAHHGPELSLVHFDLDDLGGVERVLL